MLVHLIEDNESHAILCKINLSRMEDKVMCCDVDHDLLSALRRLKGDGYKPDIIFLDLILPRGNGKGFTEGLEAVRAVSLVRPDVPILVLTSHYDVGLAKDSLRHGASHYVTKSMINQIKLLELSVAMAIQSHRLLNVERHHDRVLEKARLMESDDLASLPRLIVACSSCGNVRSDSVESGEGWMALSEFLEMHGIRLSHTYCPNCIPDYVEKVFTGE